MRVLCFSSFTFAYLDRARVLFRSLRRYQPHWELVALITDVPPRTFNFVADDEPFDSVQYADRLGIDEFRSWIFKHNVIEACTAVKGPFVQMACFSDADAVVYLDPDTCVFSSLAPIEELLETWDVVLTPHTVTPATDPRAIIDNEICSLKTGIYNLGFCAIRTSGEGRRFADWWADRLLSYGYDDIPNGLFVDQRWCDHVPALFDRVKILRDPGYNVASWNLVDRKVAIGPDGVTVNGSPLRFWHFTKLGPIGDVMTKRYAADNFPVYEIWNWYKRQIAGAADPAIPNGYWAYSVFDNGVAIEQDHRLRYRADKSLQNRFLDPFRVGDGSYYDWMCNNGLAGSLVPDPM
ncbi:MAG TPA: hypothetical protein VIJ77_00780 [Candidatus Tumulicola sp.]